MVATHRRYWRDHGSDATAADDTDVRHLDRDHTRIWPAVIRREPPPLECLRRGERFEEYALFVESAVRAIVKKRPHSEGRPWTADDVRELCQDFFDSARHVQIVIRAADDVSIRRLTLTAVRHMVTDRQRATDRGKLYRRLKEILVSDFDEGPRDWWRERGAPEGPLWDGREADLLAATWEAEDVRLVNWNPDAKRDGPLADRPSFVRVLTAIFRRAAAAVRIDSIVDVVARRFNVSSLPRVESLDLPILRSSEPEDGVPTTGDAAGASPAENPEVVAIAHEFAAEIWTRRLDEREHKLLPYLSDGGRAVEGDLDIGLRKSAAHDALERLKAKLATLLGDLTEAEQIAVVAHLRQLEVQDGPR